MRRTRAAYRRFSSFWQEHQTVCSYRLLNACCEPQAPAVGFWGIRPRPTPPPATLPHVRAVGLAVRPRRTATTCPGTTALSRPTPLPQCVEAPPHPAHGQPQPPPQCPRQSASGEEAAASKCLQPWHFQATHKHVMCFIVHVMLNARVKPFHTSSLLCPQVQLRQGHAPCAQRQHINLRGLPPGLPGAPHMHLPTVSAGVVPG